MPIRNTIGFLTDRTRYFAQLRSANLTLLQFQASTGLKHSRASEDPFAAEKILGLNRTLTRLDADKGIMDEAEHTLNLSVGNLTDAHQLVRQAQRLAIDARQAGDSEREILASELDNLINRLVDLGNATEGSRYLYGGQDDKAAPFSRNEDGTFPAANYTGSSASLSVSLSESVQIELLRSGESIFASQSRVTTIFVGQTGAKSGSGTDNEITQGTLQVTHTLSSYAGASGVTAGLDSVGGDTIIGATGTHQITIEDQSGTGAFGIARLNNGVEFAWTSADDNLQIEGTNGEIAYIDTQNITAGFNGTVNITADGVLSTDGGATTTPITYNANQVVQNSTSEKVTNVDSTEITSTGVEQIEYQGTSDLFTAIAELQHDIRNSRDLTPDEWKASLDRRGAELERHAEQLLTVIGEQSVSLETIESLRIRNRDYHHEVSVVLDDVESADLTDVVLKLQQEQNLLEYTYAVSSRIINQNILNYLR